MADRPQIKPIAPGKQYYVVGLVYRTEIDRYGNVMHSVGRFVDGVWREEKSDSSTARRPSGRLAFGGAGEWTQIIG